ncbi:hypothetical protein [Alienimonas californiensis]|uniref:Uncharacterized protein n=1 Tax=Alienimonas californiensis TaxID=2527989 RepID=A0A517PAH0_9PLAN|nr:hypothetical protein [Alienimonas californiensis]QDT16378.1 hypothetical protein CA12_24800 [Alienimonas californiensis]
MTSRDPGTALGFRPKADGGNGKAQPLPPEMVAALLRNGGDGRERFVCESVGRFVLAAADAVPTARDALFAAVAAGQLVDADLLLTRVSLTHPEEAAAAPEWTDATARSLINQAAETVLVDGDFYQPPGYVADATLSVAAEVLRRAELRLDRTACRNFLDDYDRKFEAAHLDFPRVGGKTHLPLSQGLVKRGDSGELAVSRDQERAFLKDRLDKLNDHFRRPLSLPPAADGGPPRQAAGWGPFAAVDPALRAWFAIKGLDRLRTSVEIGEFRPAVDTVPTLSADAEPPLEGPQMLSDERGVRPVAVRYPELNLLAYRAWADIYGRRDFERGEFDVKAWRRAAGERIKFLSAGITRTCASPELADVAAESLIFGLGDDDAVELAQRRGADGTDLAARMSGARESLLQAGWNGFAANLSIDPYEYLPRVAGLDESSPFEEYKEASKAFRAVLPGGGGFGASAFHVFTSDRGGENREVMFRFLAKTAAESGDAAAPARVERFRQSPKAAAAALREPVCGAGGAPAGPVACWMRCPAGVTLTRGEILAATVFELERAGARPSGLLADGVLCRPPDEDPADGVLRCRKAAATALGTPLPRVETQIRLRTVPIF